jgi:type-1 restriction enzyme ecoEI specificity protein
MTPEQLKSSILQYAIQGKLVEQRPEEGTGEELYQQIQAEKQRLVKEGKIKKEKPLPEIAENEIPFDIPESWKWARLSSVIELQSGQDMTPDKYNADHVGIPYITGASNITNGDVLINRWTECGKAFAYKGDILFTCKGTVGTMAVLQEPKVHIARQIMAIHPIGSISVYYIQIVLDTLVSSLKAAAKSIIPGIAREDILTSLIPLPPLAEQTRIIAKIGKLLPLVDRYAAAYEKLEQFNAKFPEDMKKSVLQYAIQGKLVEQRAEEGTGKELYQQIQTEKQHLIAEKKIKKEKPLAEISEDEIPFDIPESWKWVRLQNITTVLGDGIHGTPQYTINGGYYFINGNNLAEGRIEIKSDTKQVDVSEYGKHKKPLDTNTILISINGTIGNYAFYEGEPIILGKSACYFSLLSGVSKEYICMLIKSKVFFDYAKREATQTTIKNVSLKSMRMLPVPLPPLAEQKRIVEKLEELLPLCERLK